MIRNLLCRPEPLAAGLGLLIAMAQPAHADWVSLGKAAPAAPTIEASGRIDETVIEFTIPGVELREIDGYTHVSIPGSPKIMSRGYPELPLVTTSILLPAEGAPQIEVVAAEESEISLTAKVAPSQGHFTRNIPSASVPRTEGEAYAKDAFYPAAEFRAEVGNPYIMHDVRGASVRISPVVYNPLTGKLRVAKKIRVKVSTKDSAIAINELSAGTASIAGEFAPIYKKLFVNFDQADLGALPVEDAGRAVILCPDQWLASLERLQAWRTTKGLDSKLVPMSTVGTTAEEIKTFIASEYAAGGLTYILLVGDGDSMPTLKGENEGADCDACYAKLEGDDHIPDAFVSRFSAQTTDDVDVQVNRAIAYEKTPVVGDLAGFYRTATGIASNEGNPTDKERAEWLRTALEGAGYTTVDKIYDPGANPTKVAEAVNAGRGLINYIGHGSKTAWVTSSFGVSHAKQLTNSGGLWPMIWSVACVNGDFVYGSDCFGEAWAKAGTPDDPRGAIGIVAASTNMSWVPPCGWQSIIVKDYMINGQFFTGGALHYYGTVKNMEEWGDDASSEGVMILEQCIYFGDCAVQIRTSAPQTPTVSKVEDRGHDRILSVMVGDKPVRSARVVVKCEGEAPKIGVTNAEGRVTFTCEREGSATVTVTGPNLIPVLDQAMQL
jgi:hypothetical protein